jgi:Na+/H+ antiporter NhaD/arsenite permease-like protein
MLFLLTAAMCAAGAASPAAIVIVAPIGITFAIRNGISPLYAGLMAASGAAAGAFAPNAILGGIVLSTLETKAIFVDRALLFGGTFAFNVLVAVCSWAFFGRRRRFPTPSSTDGQVFGAPHTDAYAPMDGANRISGREPGTKTTEATSVAVAAPERPIPDTCDAVTATPERISTMAALAILVAGSAILGLDTGFTALTVAAALALVFRKSAAKVMSQIAWPVILLVCGIVID